MSKQPPWESDISKEITDFFNFLSPATELTLLRFSIMLV
ncbi:MAG: hypothetical protein KHX91_02910 [Clostridium sp.]|nr:hypothetical protein [Clostridium sp.]MEE0252869.1 hypothetical protein [Acutalibacteraceae bacterium]